MRFCLALLLALVVAGSAAAQDRLYPSSLAAGELGTCLTPIETFGYKLDKSDPLYDTAREDHQRYLEELEDYVNCLDRERSQALADLRSSFDLFMENFGRDAVLKYAAEKQERDQ